MTVMSVNIMMDVDPVITNAKIPKDLFYAGVILVMSSMRTTLVAMISKSVQSKMVAVLIHVSKSKVLITVNVQKVMNWGAMMPRVLILTSAITEAMDVPMHVLISMEDTSVLVKEAKNSMMIKRHA